MRAINKENRLPTKFIKTMPTALQQSVLIGACLLALSASLVSCNGNQQLAAAERLHGDTFALASNVGQSNNQIKQQSLPTYQSRVQSTNALSASPITQNVDEFGLAQASSGLITPSSQPSVYHSIIDRTDAFPSLRQASPAIQTSTITSDGDLNTAAGHHHGHAYGKYYEYRAVPKKKTWKFGYKRGNHKHTISRHEHGKAGKHPHFKTKVKWHDKKSKGKGIHLWDYNHHDKKHYHHH